MTREFLNDLAKIDKFYTITDIIDPETTAVVLIKSSFCEAILYYAKKNKETQVLPTFIVLDFQEIENDPVLLSLIKKYSAKVVSIHSKDQIPQKCFCFYTKSEVYKEIKIIKITAILSACMEHFGINNNISIDVSVFDLLHQPPARADFVESRMDDIIKIYNALNDDLSREQFLRVIKFLQTGSTCYLAPAPYPQYEHPIVKAEKGDYIIEGGLDAGNTTIKFLEQIGADGHIYAFEPLKKSYEKTQRKAASYSNATIEHYGLFSKSMQFYIENLGCSSYLVETPTANSEKCKAIKIDDYAKRNISKCDMIKLDIEGAEIECLIGAENTISKFCPKLQISIYHLPPNQYLDIPLMILDKYPEYQLYIGHHGLWIWETMLYAIKK